VKSDPEADLLPGEWAVLGAIAAAPAHGFAVASTLAPDGELGRIWTMKRSRVYRAIADLAGSGLIAPVGEAQSTRGPARVVFKATPRGRARLKRWLATPVEHIRDVRSALLLKLALLDAAGAPSRPLLLAQRATLQPLLASLEGGSANAASFDAVLLRYRVATARGVLAFIDDELRLGDSSRST
jgi:PadR family transcriptional regulator AphA